MSSIHTTARRDYRNKAGQRLPGVTTVIDMPLNAIPPTTTIAGFNEKLAASQGQCWVDVGFYGGVIPGNARELLPLVEAGVRGFKGFLIDSGVSAQMKREAT